jgi:hypothetical protein
MKRFQLTNRLSKPEEERYSRVISSLLRNMILRQDFVLLAT